MAYKSLNKLLFCTFLFFAHTFAQSQNSIILATSTSTENSGLLHYLLPMFEQQHQIKVKVVSVGTGKAIKLAEEGNVDLILVHAPDKEKEFVSKGHGVNRQALMYNNFIIVGSVKDTAKIEYLADVKAAFAQIAQKQSLFVSRGDYSGTHTKERDIWQQLNIKPDGAWHREVGQGMGKTLQIASELGAYTLTDESTWLFMQDKLKLKKLHAGDPILFNPYSIITVNPKKHRHIKHNEAKIFVNWLVSSKTKALINQFKIADKQLFYAL